MKKFSVKQGDQVVLKEDHIALTEEGAGEPSDFAGYDKVKLPRGLKGMVTFVGSNGSFDVIWDNMIHSIETVNKKEIKDVMRVAKKGKESHKDKAGRYERRPESEFKAGDEVMLIDPSSLGYLDGRGDYGTIVITKDPYGVESIHPEPNKDTVSVEWENGKIEPVFENKLVKVSVHYNKFDKIEGIL